MFDFGNILDPAFSYHNTVDGLELSDLISDDHFPFPPNDPNSTNMAPSSSVSTEGDNVSSVVLKRISKMLMEDEDLETSSSMLQDSVALQAAEKSFYDVLGEKYAPSPIVNPPPNFANVKSPINYFTRPCSIHSSNSPVSVNTTMYINKTVDQERFGSSPIMSSHLYPNFDYVIKSNMRMFDPTIFWEAANGAEGSPVNPVMVFDSFQQSQAIAWFMEEEGKFLPMLQKDFENYEMGGWEERNRNGLAGAEKNLSEQLASKIGGKKSHYREDAVSLEAGRSNKHLASFVEDSDELPEMFDKLLLCPSFNSYLDTEFSSCLPDDNMKKGMGGKQRKNEPSKGSSREKSHGKKQVNRKEVVDLMDLLTKCARAVASNDRRNTNELLKQIRHHSSSKGDSIERMAHYIANALEARLDGTGIPSDASLSVKQLTASDTLKGYLAFHTACPFKLMSYFFANKWILKLAEDKPRLHIVDFGIIHGFQWLHLIQHLSLRPGGPPSVCITGIDFPQPGFRPSERVEGTGRRLTYYSEKFGVPFTYNGIAKRWDTIKLDDLKIQRDEVLIVNCLYWLRCVPDETLKINSPRNSVLSLIRRANPDLFVHGIVNGTFNSPFFATRFRETLFQAYAAFDMFEAILPREDQGRMLYEREVLGRVAMSVIACEGTERIIRPETYKQWQVRNIRAGLKQLPLDQKIMENVRAKLKFGYHEDFVVDQDSDWMLQEWKGRILLALSCWKPVN